MSARCRIEMLGGLQVHLGGRVITRFRTQKAASLLACLAYYRDRSHPREWLADLLWPESEPRTRRGQHALVGPWLGPRAGLQTAQRVRERTRDLRLVRGGLVRGRIVAVRSHRSFSVPRVEGA